MVDLLSSKEHFLHQTHYNPWNWSLYTDLLTERGIFSVIVDNAYAQSQRHYNELMYGRYHPWIGERDNRFAIEWRDFDISGEKAPEASSSLSREDFPRREGAAAEQWLMGAFEDTERWGRQMSRDVEQHVTQSVAEAEQLAAKALEEAEKLVADITNVFASLLLKK